MAGRPAVGLRPILSLLALLEAAAVAVHFEDVDVAGQPIDIGDDGRLVFPAAFVVRFGEGDYRRGQRLLEHGVADIRKRRSEIRLAGLVGANR